MREERAEFTDLETVAETIAAGSVASTLSYYNTSIIQKIDDVEYSVHNIIYDYLDEINSLAQVVQLDDLQYIKYEYRPDLLSYFLYGTIDYAFVILAMNGILSEKDFTKKKLKLLSSADMNNIMNKIYNAESSYLTKNRHDYINQSVTT